MQMIGLAITDVLGSYILNDSVELYLDRITQQPMMNQTSGKVYPNPVVNTLYISLSNSFTTTSPILVSVTDVYGRSKYSSTFYPASQFVSLDLSNLFHGVYTVSVSQDGHIQRFSVTKK